MLTATPGRHGLKRFSRLVVPLLGAALLSACASLVGPREVEVPLAKLQQGLERRFPLNHRILSVFEVRLSKPQLALLPGDRVGLTLDASVAPPFIQTAWRGNLALSGRLVLDTARNAVFLSDARIERVAVDGVDPALQRQFIKVANLVGDQFMRDTPLYNFRPDELRYAGVQFTPTHLAMTPAALVVTFEPLK